MPISEIQLLGPISQIFFGLVVGAFFIRQWLGERNGNGKVTRHDLRDLSATMAASIGTVISSAEISRRREADMASDDMKRRDERFEHMLIANQETQQQVKDALVEMKATLHVVQLFVEAKGFPTRHFRQSQGNPVDSETDC